MKKTSTLLLAATAYFLTLNNSINAQVTIASENFDASSTNLPTGWSSTAGGWTVSTSNSSTLAASSGSNNLKIDNTGSATGSYSIVTTSFVTTNYSNITVSWGARLTTNFPPSTITPSVYFSVNGGASWSAIPYTETSSASAWSLNGPISLPAAANNQATLKIQLVANIQAASSGTYRIDDFTVKGINSTSLNENVKSDFLKAYTYDNVLYFNSNNSEININQINVYDITGKKIISENINNKNTDTLNLNYLTPGIYILKAISTNNELSVKKIIVE